VAPFALLAPCTGVVASALLFGERFGALRYAGMALILLGLATILLPARGRRAGAQQSASSGIHSAGGAGGASSS
jgi:drug/metabolite transporter (DMT)-like permease